MDLWLNKITEVSFQSPFTIKYVLVFHLEYEEYIRAIGGQPPIQPMPPPPPKPVSVPAPENVTQPPQISKARTKRRPGTQRQRIIQGKEVNKEEDNGLITLTPPTPPSSTQPSSTAPSSATPSESPPIRRQHSAPSPNGNQRERKSRRQTRKPRGKKVETPTPLVPAHVGGRLDVRERQEKSKPPPNKIEDIDIDDGKASERPGRSSRPMHEKPVDSSPMASERPLASEKPPLPSERPLSSEQVKASERPKAKSEDDKDKISAPTTSAELAKKSKLFNLEIQSHNLL